MRADRARAAPRVGGSHVATIVRLPSRRTGTQPSASSISASKLRTSSSSMSRVQQVDEAAGSTARRARAAGRGGARCPPRAGSGRYARRSPPGAPAPSSSVALSISPAASSASPIGRGCRRRRARRSGACAAGACPAPRRVARRAPPRCSRGWSAGPLRRNVPCARLGPRGVRADVARAHWTNVRVLSWRRARAIARAPLRALSPGSCDPPSPSRGGG